MDTTIEHRHKERVVQMVRDYSDQLYSWAFFKTSSKEIAEDLVQDTFVAAMQGLDKFEEKSNIKTWLYSILNNKIVDHYRKQGRRARHENALSEEQANHLSEQFFDQKGHWAPDESKVIWGVDSPSLDDPEFNVMLDTCINDLPPNWKFVITSKYLLGKGPDEICKELEVSTSNYWQITRRAKMLLKKCLHNKMK